MNRLPDHHSIEFEFENLDIEVDGLKFAEVTGTAELMNDDAYLFFVNHIVLNGRRHATGWRKWHTVPGILHLPRPAAGDTSPKARLFQMIEAALYDYEPAIEKWREQQLMAAE